MCFVNILLARSLSLHFLSSGFHRTEVFNFNKIHLVSFYFMDRDFGVVSKKSSPNPRLPRFSPMLPSRGYIT